VPPRLAGSDNRVQKSLMPKGVDHPTITYSPVVTLRAKIFDAERR